MKWSIDKVMRKLNTGKKFSKRMLMTGAMALCLMVTYLVYNHLMADASVTVNKYLTGNGEAANGASVSIGSYANTTNDIDDTNYYGLVENTNGVGTLAWNFTQWEQMLETSGNKVTKVTLSMGANMVTSSSTSTSGDKTIRFSMYNFSSGQYDIYTTATRRLNSASTATFTLEFPTTDYTNYFNENGYFQIQMVDIAKGTDTNRDRIRITYMYVNISYDTTAPTATWSSPSGIPTSYYTNTTSLNLSASGTDNEAEASGIAHMDFYYNNGTGENVIGWSNTPASGNANSGSWNYTWDNPPEDTYSIYARAVDGKNNVSSTTALQNIVVDRTLPVASFSNPVINDRIGGSSYTIMGSASDAVKMDYYKLEYYRQGVGPWTQIGSNQTIPVTDGVLGTWNTTAVADGKYDLRLTVVDKAGNQKVTTVSDITVDNTGPVVSVEYYTDQLLTIPFGTVGGKPTVSGAVYVKLTANEVLRNNQGDNQITIDAPGSINDITNQDFRWNGVAWVATWAITSGYDGDSAAITVKGTDILGNVSTASPSSGAAITVDTAAPVAFITSPTNGASVTGSYAVQGTASDAKGFNYYKVEYYDSKTNSWNQIGTNQSSPVTNNTLVTWNSAAILDGTYKLRLTAYDQAYNCTTSEVTGLITDNFGPILGLEYYQDVTLTTPLENYLGKPITTARSVYVKLVTNKTLRNTAGDNQLTIDAPGTVNDVTNGNFTWDGTAWVYTWQVKPGSDGNTSSITVKGTSSSGLLTSGVPTTGAVVSIDNATGMPTVAATSDVEKIKLTWTVDADFKEVYVYKGAIGTFTPGDENLVAVVDLSTGYEIEAHKKGYFKIRFKDLAGNFSPYSSVVSAIPKDSIKKAYIRYLNSGSNVYISVYWNDIGGGSAIQWANDVVAAGNELDWKATGITLDGTESASASATILAEEYKNYYFRLSKNGEVNNLRAFPVDTNVADGPRYSNEYAHGNYSEDTDMCAACHTTHVGLKSKLLNQSTYYDLCLLCHGTAATQSKYDVQSGMVKTAAGWKNSLAGPIGTEYGTSKHNVDDRSDVTTTVYGSAPGKTLTFTCLSCHKPHGGMDDNYRLLRDTIYPADDQFASTTVSYRAYAVVKDQTVGEEVYMISGNSEFCAACHMDYVKGSSKHSGGDYAQFYRHPVTVGNQAYGVYDSGSGRNFYPNPADGLPLQVNNAGQSVGPDKRTAIVCSTCHYAHGTYKNFNMPYPQPWGAPRQIETNQKMLRLDNYGVCESCHKK